MLATLYDASLDMFRKNSWDFSIYPYNYSYTHWNSPQDFQVQNFHLFQKDWNPYVYGTSKSYDALNWFGIYLYGYRGYYAYQSRPYGRGSRSRNGRSKDYDEGALDDLAVSEERAPMPAAPTSTASGGLKNGGSSCGENDDGGFSSRADGERGETKRTRCTTRSSTSRWEWGNHRSKSENEF